MIPRSFKVVTPDGDTDQDRAQHMRELGASITRWLREPGGAPYFVSKLERMHASELYAYPSVRHPEPNAYGFTIVLQDGCISYRFNPIMGDSVTGRHILTVAYLSRADCRAYVGPSQLLQPSLPYGTFCDRLHETITGAAERSLTIGQRLDRLIEQLRK